MGLVLLVRHIRGRIMRIVFCQMQNDRCLSRSVLLQKVRTPSATCKTSTGQTTAVLARVHGRDRDLQMDPVLHIAMPMQHKSDGTYCNSWLLGLIRS